MNYQHLLLSWKLSDSVFYVQQLVPFAGTLYLLLFELLTKLTLSNLGLRLICLLSPTLPLLIVRLFWKRFTFCELLFTRRSQRMMITMMSIQAHLCTTPEYLIHFAFRMKNDGKHIISVCITQLRSTTAINLHIRSSP